MKTYNKFKKGDLIYTDFGFPAFVYENQGNEEYVSIYAFGFADEWGSEYGDKAVPEWDKERWFDNCKTQGYAKDYVLDKAREFKIKL